MESVTHAWIVESQKKTKKHHHRNYSQLAHRANANNGIHRHAIYFANTVSNYSQRLTLHRMKLLWAVDPPQIANKLDTGASITAIPQSVYLRARDGELQNAQRMICGPNNQPLTVLWHVQCTPEKGKQKNEQEMFVVKNSLEPGFLFPLTKNWLWARKKRFQGSNSSLLG